MRVVMNGLAALKPKTGVGHYVHQLHRHLQHIDTDSRFDLYPNEPIASILSKSQRRPSKGSRAQQKRSLRQEAMRLGLLTAKHMARTAAGIHFAHRCRAEGYQLYHEPNFIPFAVDLPTVVTVHDMSTVLHPEWHPADRVKHHARHLAHAVRRAAHIIVVSEQVRSEVMEVFSVSPNRVTAVHNGIAPEFRRVPEDRVAECLQRLGLPRRYFLAVGTIEPRKNILTLMRAFVDLPESLRRECPLILAGPWGWKSHLEREYLETTAGPAGVRHLGYLPEADLPSVYNGAAALLYPSFYEGFGLPPIEMLACGGTVVCSQEAEAVREVVGLHGYYCPAHDVASWRDMMRELALKKVKLPTGESHAMQYHWDAAARKTLAVYEQVLGIQSKRYISHTVIQSSQAA